MALEITGNIKIDGGIIIPSIYARTFYNVNVESKEVLVGIYSWGTKEAYLNNDSSVTAHIKLKTIYSYDREVDGTDILDFTQIKVKEDLESQGYSVVITDL